MDRYIVTTRPSAKALAGSPESCFHVLNVPVTSLEPNDAFDASVITGFNPDIAVFTSTYGVDLFFGRFNGDFSSKVAFVAIGSETAKALSRWGKKATVPERRTSEGVVQLLSGTNYTGKSIVLFVSSKSNGIIQSYLEEHHTRHIVAVLYSAEVLPAADFAEKVLHSECLGIVVTSSFEARAIFEHALDKGQVAELCAEKKVFAIGKTTERELQALRIPVSVPVGKSDLEKLLEEISRKYCENK